MSHTLAPICGAWSVSGTNYLDLVRFWYHIGTMNGAQLSLFDLGPARRPATPDFWTREEEDRDDYSEIAADHDTNEEI